MEPNPPRLSTNETSVVTTTRGANVVSQHRVWWVLLLLASIIFSIVFRPKSSSSAMALAYALGSVVGILLTASVLAGIPWFISVIARRRMTVVQFMSTFTIGVGLVMASRLAVFMQEQKTNVDIGNVVSAPDVTVFAPRNSDFAVTFTSEPTVEAFEVVTTDGKILKGTRAELHDRASFQRVEVVPMPRGFADTATRESAISHLREYAFHNGINSPEFTFEVSPLGPCASMRGTKVLDDAGTQRAVTFQAVAYYGDSSLFGVYVGALSRDYPQASIVAFLRSVRKK